MKKSLLCIPLLLLLACPKKSKVLTEVDANDRVRVSATFVDQNVLFTLTTCVHFSTNLEPVFWPCHVVSLTAEPVISQ